MKQPFLLSPQELATANTQYLAPLSTRTTWVAASTLSNVVVDGGAICVAAGSFGQIHVQRINRANGALPQVGASITETFTLYVNGVSTAATLSITGTGTSGDYTGWGATVGIGDVLTLVRTTSGGTPNTSGYSISLVFRGATANRSVYGGLVLPNSTATRYISPFTPTSASAESSRLTSAGSSIVPCYGDVTFLSIALQTAPGAGKSWTFKLYKDGSAIAASAITIADAATTGTATFTEPFVPTAFPELTLEMVPSGTPATTYVRFGMRFAATALEFVNSETMEIIAEIEDNISCGVWNPGALPATGSDQYTGGFSWAAGAPGAVDTLVFTEWPDVDGTDFNVALANLFVKVDVEPGGSATREFIPRYYDEITDLVYEDVWAAAPILGALGNTTTAATATVGGATQFASYPSLGQVNQKFALRCDVTSIPNATVYTWLGAMVFVDSFAPSVVAFDGTVTNISPDNGPTAGSTAFTITGSGFQGTAGGGAYTITGASVALRGIAATGITIVNDTTITGTSAFSETAGTGDVVITFTTNGPEGDVAIATLDDGWTYTGAGIWWRSDDPSDADTDGGLPVEGPIWIFQDTSPGDGWVQDTAPQPYGWWISREGMAGGPFIADGSRVPKGPRTIADVDVFATGAAAHLQGNCAVVFRNKLIYAARGYTVDTDDPPLRIYDGLSDRFLVGVPKDASLAPAEAVMAMLVANGTIYIATLDNNAGGGRILEFDLDSLTFTPIGAAFGSGDVPYVMCWHLGRLWVGTNDGDGTAQAVYFIRPGIDSAFTTDRSLSTDTLGGVASMVSYKGKLYVGCDNVNGQNGKILVRSELGVYAVSETGTGTSAMNGYVAMAVFNDNLYAAYWNSSGSVSRIRKFDNSSWSTVYTGAATTAVPILALFVHDRFLYALFGTTTAAAALVRSDSGTSYTDLSAFLTPGTILATPAYGSLRF